jgi:crotonobetainyl-CoA:carnitine CoA-transferase CaiB-like acyl-CoA transferase
LVQAFAGFGDGLNPVGSPPLTSRVLLTDCLGALVTCEGIVGGLYINQTTGRGVGVSSSLLEGAMAAQGHVLDALAVDTESGRRAGRPVWGPLDYPIETEDGSVVVTVEQQSDYRRLCEICRVDGDRRSRPRTPDTDQTLAQCLARGSASQWQKVLADAGMACQVVTRDLAVLTEDPRLAGLFEPLAHGAFAPACPWEFIG